MNAERKERLLRLARAYVAEARRQFDATLSAWSDWSEEERSRYWRESVALLQATEASVGEAGHCEASLPL